MGNAAAGDEPSGRPDARLAEYAEVNANFRLLTDIRFKLLAFLPLAVAAAVGAIGVTRGAGADSVAEIRTLALFLFGLAVTVALATYNARNDQIYVWLVERGAQIERELGIPGGSFAQRPNAWFEVAAGPIRWSVSHEKSIGSIYAAATALWLAGAAVTSIQLAAGSTDISAGTYTVAVAIAAVFSFGAGSVVRRQRERRREQIRGLAAEAVALAVRIHGGSSEHEGNAAYGEFVEICTRLIGTGRRRQRQEEVKRRIDFYAQMSLVQQAEYGFDWADPELAAEIYLALLVDLPRSMLRGRPSRRW